MNEFYSIADIGKEKTNSLQLENLGKDRIFAISGNSNSYHRSYTSVTANDYDLDFSNRIITTNPPYDIFALLDFHFQYYTDITKGDRQKFFNHIKYVICPMIEKRKGKGVYIELIGNWIRDKELSKKKKMVKKRSAKKKELKSIFISHASKDKVIVDAFVDLILHGGLSVPINEIFCISTDGTKIKSGDAWRESIKENLMNAKINFLVITPHYKESEVCMNEMGAAWVTSAKVIPFIVDPINYKTVGVIQEPTQIEKLLDEGSLDRVKDIIQRELDIPAELIKSDRWTGKKTEFLLRVRGHLVKNPFTVPMDRTAFNGLIKSKGDLEKAVEGLIDEKAKLEKLVEELKKAKDKEDVKAIMKKRETSSDFDEFERLCDNVSKMLAKNPPIINGIIFKSFSGKDIVIRGEGNRDELDEALANDYIDSDLDVRWDATKKMRDLDAALNQVSKFISKKGLGNDFYDAYDENYNAPMKMSNKEFWEEVLGATISLN